MERNTSCEVCLTFLYASAVAKKGKKKARAALAVPKLKCCESRNRCRRCPTRMLKEGTLPDGLGVRRRRLVAADTPLVPLTKKQVRVLIASSTSTASTSGKGGKRKELALAKSGKRTGRKAA